ncbi:unnamed protein product [Anisakis simplex]|uniref:Cytochrome b561 domain-containing protein n=1 Tax=Anisakis simplex TaxID=6269 RepID=A0A0M3JXH7_ANISI|nr:unnamed protein product [Anisakis simplex]
MLSYRLFRHETKIMSKMVHTLMHLGTFALIIGALFLFGAINFWLPSMETGESFLPSHKLVGLTIFIASVSQALIGYAQLPLIIQNHSNLNDTFTQSNQYGAQRLTTSSLVLNFTVIFTIIYAMCVVYLVSEDEWRRQKTPDETK